MKRKNEKVPGFDEIIFENRNKEYGAYNLRKRYNSTECFSILGGVGLFVSLIIGLTFTIEQKGTAKNFPTIVIAKFDPIDPELNKIRREEPPKPVIINNQGVYKVPEVVNDTNADSHSFASVDAIIDFKQNLGVNDTLFTVINSDHIIPVEPDPVISVEEMPVFPGGEEALLKFIAGSIKYPEEAAANGIQGRVTLRFVVSSDGSVKRVEVLRGIDPVLNTEAIRVVSSLPKWKPGKQNGKAVPVWFFVPVNFKLKYN
jgi:periplasmic protein TonB